jgi:hypothetical protein
MVIGFVIVESLQTSSSAARLVRSARTCCLCCGGRRSRRAAKRFCTECLDRAKQHDVDDPYDELGEGD